MKLLDHHSHGFSHRQSLVIVVCARQALVLIARKRNSSWQFQPAAFSNRLNICTPCKGLGPLPGLDAPAPCTITDSPRGINDLQRQTNHSRHTVWHGKLQTKACQVFEHNLKWRRPEPDLLHALLDLSPLAPLLHAVHALLIHCDRRWRGHAS